jgi:Spy/CpxP family protein refolding chaperone
MKTAFIHPARLLAAMIVTTSLAGGQPAPATARGAPPGPEQALEQHVFPPELIMQFQQKIGLRAEQRDAIRSAISETQTKALDMQWKLQDEAQKLVDALERVQVNESETLAQVDRVLSAEREVKRAQMAMLIRIKNVLTADQQAMLRELRKAAAREEDRGPRSEVRGQSEGIAVPDPQVSRE